MQADAAPSAAPANPEPLSFRAEGERRHLTVLFCDLVGSATLAAQMDTEDWREAVAAYHHTATAVITRFGGHTATFLRDGVMASFGWPEAHDNDAERAGLAMLEAITQLHGGTARPKLAARIGIDSGTVVVGTGASAAADVFGERLSRAPVIEYPGLIQAQSTRVRPGDLSLFSERHFELWPTLSTY